MGRQSQPFYLLLLVWTWRPTLVVNSASVASYSTSETKMPGFSSSAIPSMTVDAAIRAYRWTGSFLGLFLRDHFFRLIAAGAALALAQLVQFYLLLKHFQHFQLA